ncbi:hypothetical protein [Salinimicrobium xinjiangense]|uniref:hypothetical protein n=1 Tax=Salinimicrobium xinjiangense TaxID=438596 RepID=UPI000402ADC1|nr:hypothetical protein [Salinimicrobium xinjiangense]
MPATTVFLLIAAFLLSLALAGFQYFFRSKGRRAQNLIFGTLRFITLFCVLLLLINPKITSTEYTLEKPTLVLAVDNSSSIKELGAGEEVRSLVEKIQDDSELQKQFDIQTFTFGRDLEQNGEINFLEKQTDLPRVFKDLEMLFREKNAPLLLITDGNQTMGEDITFVARRFRQPVIPVVAGDTTTYQDLSISRLNVNKYAFLNNRFPVEVIVNYSGKTSVETQLEIRTGNSVVFKRNISFSAENSSEVINAELSANSIGTRIYEVRLSPLESEKNILNNKREFAVEVVDERTNVLIAYSFLHPDVGALKRSIESNQQREVDLKLITEVTDPDAYQLHILYQPDNRFANLISGLNSGNRNYLVVTGPKTDWRFLNQVQSVFEQELTFQTEEFFPVWNENFKAFQNEDLQFSRFPPLAGNFGHLGFPEDMDILLYRQVQGVKTQEPLLAIAESEGSKMAFLLGADIWRWRNHVYQESGSFQKFDELIGKLVQVLASGSRNERLIVSYEPLYQGDEAVIIQADYFDQNYNFDPRASLKLRLTEEGNGTSEIPFLLKQNSYQVDLSNLEAGEYRFRVNVDGESISRSGNFRIEDFDVEKQFASANLSGMQKVAADKGQQVYFPAEFEKLRNQLLSDDSYAIVQKSHEKDVSLIDWKYLLLIIILALSAEWFLRKYYGRI